MSVYTFFSQLYYSILSLLYHQKLNLVVLGFPNSGKSTLINMIAGNHYQADTIPTIGVDFKYLQMDNLLLKIFDISGQERFQASLWKDYYRTEADIVIYVIDLSDALSLRTARKKLIEVLLETNNRNVPLMILGNKIDLLRDHDFVNLAEDNINDVPNVGLNNNNSSSLVPVNKEECFMKFLGLKQETQEKFVLKRKVSNPNINRIENNVEMAGQKKSNTKNLVIEHQEEEIIEFDRDLGVFLISCKENQALSEAFTWLMGR